MKTSLFFAIKGGFKIDIKNDLEEIKIFANQNNFEKIKDTTLKIEKRILDSYKNNDFKRLIDNIMIYSNYSFFNTLLIDYQYPDFLDLGTENKYHKQGINILDNATRINILSPSNNIYVRIKDNDTERIELLNNLNDNELSRYNNSNDLSITLHHKELKCLNIIELIDCKDTSMTKEDYKGSDLPSLFYCDYNDIYNSFVKAIYASGYKVSYCDNIDDKFSYNKTSKTISIKNGLNCRTKMSCMLDVYSSDITNNDFDKRLFNYAINRSIGIDDKFMDNTSIIEWYKNSDIKNVEHSLKLLSSKARKFSNNFYRFYNLEKKNFDYDNTSLYDDFNLSI